MPRCASAPSRHAWRKSLPPRPVDGDGREEFGCSEAGAENDAVDRPHRAVRGDDGVGGDFLDGFRRPARHSADPSPDNSRWTAECVCSQSHNGGSDAVAAPGSSRHGEGGHETRAALRARPPATSQKQRQALRAGDRSPPGLSEALHRGGQTAASASSDSPVGFRQDVRRRPLEHAKVADVRCDGRDELNRACARTDHRDALAAHIVVVTPFGGMEHRAGKSFDARQ